MYKPQAPDIELETCLEQLKAAYSEVKGDNERLQSYADLLQAILEYHKIDYPAFESPEEQNF
ncbi:hypothetical protein [Fusibacter sp. A1]|uniref:hypothetical protein n=1 Tax=Fusibacter sp. A1 TaxID=2283630 RepID=UPI00101276FF|nr:hypothetical protein [Fusibacter sp. A1]NPE20469.1 hypothetical protein [Fusibacter sp. A1]NPE20578.1 hypothetical protein [Fusibacter sp. A1]RXV63673.1 hypothetical protein DWB64_01460 [Fusibacter sp. A1]RXV63775.1 hypothetical protein DWB64_02005 [Fusibacter sp. A1]